MDTGRNRSTGSKRSPISIIPELFHHAGIGTHSNDSVPSAGSKFQSSTIHAHGFIQSQQCMNAEFQISDSADHISSLFHVYPFATQTSFASSSNPREPRISNKALHPTVFRRCFLQKAGLARRSVTHPALAGCAPSLPRIAFHACLPEDRG